MPRSSSAVWLISEVIDVFMTVESSFKSFEQCNIMMYIIVIIAYVKIVTNRYIYLHIHDKYKTHH